jgi:hypothetical protein
MTEQRCECGSTEHPGPHWLHMDELWRAKNRELMAQFREAEAQGDVARMRMCLTAFAEEEIRRLDEKERNLLSVGNGAIVKISPDPLTWKQDSAMIVAPVRETPGREDATAEPQMSDHKVLVYVDSEGEGTADCPECGAWTIIGNAGTDKAEVKVRCAHYFRTVRHPGKGLVATFIQEGAHNPSPHTGDPKMPNTAQVPTTSPAAKIKNRDDANAWAKQVYGRNGATRIHQTGGEQKLEVGEYVAHSFEVRGVGKSWSAAVKEAAGKLPAQAETQDGAASAATDELAARRARRNDTNQEGKMAESTETVAGTNAATADQAETPAAPAGGGKGKKRGKDPLWPEGAAAEPAQAPAPAPAAETGATAKKSTTKKSVGGGKAKEEAPAASNAPVLTIKHKAGDVMRDFPQEEVKEGYVQCPYCPAHVKNHYAGKRIHLEKHAAEYERQGIGGLLVPSQKAPPKDPNATPAAGAQGASKSSTTKKSAGGSGPKASGGTAAEPTKGNGKPATGIEFDSGGKEKLKIKRTVRVESSVPSTKEGFTDKIVDRHVVEYVDPAGDLHRKVFEVIPGAVPYIPNGVTHKVLNNNRHQWREPNRAK